MKTGKTYKLCCCQPKFITDLSTYFDLSWTHPEVSFTACIGTCICQGQMQLQLNSCACFRFGKSILGRTPQVFSSELFCSIKGDTHIHISDNSEPYIEVHQSTKFIYKNIVSEARAYFCLCSLFWLSLEILHTTPCTHSKPQSNDLNPLFFTLSLESWGSRIGDVIEYFVVVCYLAMLVACRLYMHVLV